MPAAATQPLPVPPTLLPAPHLCCSLPRPAWGLADGVLVSKGELRVPDNAPKGKIPLTIPGAAKGSSSAAASALKASSRSSLLSKLTEGAAVPAAPAVPAVPAAAEEPVPRPASFSGLEGLAGSTHDDDRI